MRYDESGHGYISRTSLSGLGDTVCSEQRHSESCMVFADRDLWLPCNSCLHIGKGNLISIILGDEFSFTSFASAPSAGVEYNLYDDMVRKGIDCFSPRAGGFPIALVMTSMILKI